DEDRDPERGTADRLDQHERRAQPQRRVQGCRLRPAELIEQSLEEQPGEERDHPEGDPHRTPGDVAAGADSGESPHHQPYRSLHRAAVQPSVAVVSAALARVADARVPVAPVAVAPVAVGRAMPAAASRRANRLSGSAARAARGPYSTTRPRSTTAILSTRDSEERRCAISTAVRPASSATIAASMRASVAGS